MISQLKWQSLEERRQQSRLMFLHKYCHNEIVIREEIAVRGRGRNTNFQTINSRLRSYANSFVPSTVLDWNSLPPNVRNEADAYKVDKPPIKIKIIINVMLRI